MSWLDFGSRVDVVRLGAHAVELWRRSSVGWTCVAHEDHPGRASIYDPGAVEAPLHSVMSEVEGRSVVAVIESALLPVLLADAGGVLWRSEQVEALFRHRFQALYGGDDGGAATWQLRAEHRFGERFALGFAMAPSLRQLLARAGETSGLKWHGWVPAIAWGLDRFRRNPDGVWLWSEQDRCLVASLRRGRVCDLDPACALGDGRGRILDALAREAAEGAGEPRAEAVGWRADEIDAADGRIDWRSIEPPRKVATAARLAVAA